MTIKKQSLLSLLTPAALLFLAVATIGGSSAQAREFRHLPAGDWHRGHWIHDRHGGRLGWWWVVGPSWVYYERPHSFVIQPAPQVTVIQQAPAPMEPPPVMMAPVAVAPVAANPVLYYCRATGTHYPETMSCPGGWSTMTAETPPQPMSPQ